MSDLSIKAETLTIDNIRFSAKEISSDETLDNLLIKYHNKKVRVCQVKREPINLHGESSITARSTVLVEILTNGVRIFILFFVSMKTTQMFAELLFEYI